MNSYNDRTYCSYYPECSKGLKCFRALTPDVDARADQEHLPIKRYLKKPDCFVERSIPKRVSKMLTKIFGEKPK